MANDTGNFLAGLLNGFAQTNLAMQEQKKREQERKQERALQEKLFGMQLKKLERQDQAMNDLGAALGGRQQIDPAQGLQVMGGALPQGQEALAPQTQVPTTQKRDILDVLTDASLAPQLMQAGLVNFGDLVKAKQQKQQLAQREQFQQMLLGGDGAGPLRGMQVQDVQVSSTGEPSFRMAPGGQVARTVPTVDEQGRPVMIGVDRYGRQVTSYAAQPQYSFQTIDTPQGPVIARVDPATGQIGGVVGEPKPPSVSPLEAGTLANIQGGIDSHAEAMAILDQAKNSPLGVQGMLASGQMNIPRSAGRTFLSLTDSIGDAIIRARTGAGQNIEEAKAFAREMVPRFGDSQELIESKMQRAINFLRRQQQSVDVSQRLRPQQGTEKNDPLLQRLRPQQGAESHDPLGVRLWISPK